MGGWWRCCAPVARTWHRPRMRWRRRLRARWRYGPRRVCRRPEAWLLTAARRRLVDARRRVGTHVAATPVLRLRATLPEDLSAALPDHRLALLLACADPAVKPTARAPPMLQAVLGLEASRIAGAFLLAPAAMAQRLVRAKRCAAGRVSAVLGGAGGARRPRR